MKYNPKIVLAFYAGEELPKPEIEYRFDIDRGWRFDFAWPNQKVALEVQGGLFVNGAHVRGAAVVKEHEKLNWAAMHGWRVLYCQPSDVASVRVARMIHYALRPIT